MTAQNQTQNGTETKTKTQPKYHAVVKNTDGTYSTVTTAKKHEMKKVIQVVQGNGAEFIALFKGKQLDATVQKSLAF